ncbi:MAG: cytochrome c oxidase assembly protein, partial [Actinobacteria bacterium]
MHPYSWALHWDVLLVIAALAAAYYLSQRRWPSDTRQRAAFDLAVILLLAVYITPLHTIALHYLLSIHFLQNVATAEWAPGLVVYAVAPALGRTVARFIHPLIALPLWLATYFVWHIPVIYDAALNRPHSLLHVEHLTYFVAGVLMWWPVVHGAYSDGVKAAYLFAAFVLASPLGLLLALLPRPVYGFYK